jgi:hypothetical protein
VNYQQETLPCSFVVNLHSYANWFTAVQRALQAVYEGLDRTGRKGEWGLSGWPASTLTGWGVFSEGKRFAVIFELVNDRQEVIGRQSVNLDINWSVSINNGVKVDYNQNDFETLRYNVKADGITDSTTIRIASVNGQNPEAAAGANSLGLIAMNADEWAGNVQLRDRFSKGTITSGGDKISGSVNIPHALWGEPVTAIGDKAFAECDGLTSVSIPDSVTSIGDNAFAGCTSLASVAIPNGVTSIGEGVFENCNRLTSVTIPNSVTSIGEGAFYSCESLTSVSIPNSVTSIGEKAFYYCWKLPSVTIPNSVISIGVEAFSYCHGLTSVSIPNGVIAIEYDAFDHCSGLTSVIISSSVIKIGTRAFANCDKLTSVTFAEGSRIEKGNFGGDVFPQEPDFFNFLIFIFTNKQPSRYGNRLKKAYLAGGAGTYVRSAPQKVDWQGEERIVGGTTWSKQR